MRMSAMFRALLLTVLAGWLVMGCGDDNSTNSTGDPNLSGGGVVLLMHDAPVDSLSEVWLTVNSIRLLSSDDDTTEVDDDSTGSNGDKDLVLDEPIRMNLLALDSISRVLAVASAPAGEYSKIRLYVSNPLFVKEDATEIPPEQIKLVANGKVDLNPQGDIIILTDVFTVVSLDLDVESSVQVNQTGNEKYILHPQVFVDATVDSLESVVIGGAVIVAIDTEKATITVSVPGSDEEILIVLDDKSELLGADALVIDLSALAVGMSIDITGHLDTKRLEIWAQVVQIVS